jgi:hypothetical protein
MAHRSERTFTEAFKGRNRLVASASIVFAAAAPFAAALLVITYFVADETGWLAWTLTGAALVAAGTLTWVVQDRLALLGNQSLRERLEARLAGHEDLVASGKLARFVGFAPSEQVRVWSGETDLDVGFLCVADHGMVFVGDRFSWSLGKARIDQIDLTPAPLGPRRIIIRWHAPREPRRAFTIESREADSLRQADAATIGLFRGLRKWSVTEPPEAVEPAGLGYPPTDEYGGRPVDQLASGSCATVIAMAVIIVLTTWYLVSQMLEDGFYCHAFLWAGFVFVGGAVFTRCLLHYLQSVEESLPRHPDPQQRQP